MIREMIMMLAFAGALGATADRIAVQQNHLNALYRSGEEAVFRVCVSTDGGDPVRTGKAKWTLDNFGTTRLASGAEDGVVCTVSSLTPLGPSGYGIICPNKGVQQHVAVL